MVLALHQHLLEMMPTASGRMAGNGRPLCQRLAVGVLEGTSTDRDPAEIAYLLQHVGAANRLEGFPPEEYVSLVHALLRAVRATYRGEWSNATSSAWVEYLIWVRGHLQSGALSVSEQELEAAARQAAAPQEVEPEPEPAVPSSGGGFFDDDEDDEDDGYRGDDVADHPAVPAPAALRRDVSSGVPVRSGAVRPVRAGRRDWAARGCPGRAPAGTDRGAGSAAPVAGPAGVTDSGSGPGSDRVLAGSLVFGTPDPLGMPRPQRSRMDPPDRGTLRVCLS
jgi:hypothetical protein